MTPNNTPSEALKAAAETGEVARLAEEAKRLLTIATNASFDCGEWYGEDSAGDEPSVKPYSEVHDVSIAAKEAVCAAIDRLAALAHPPTVAPPAVAAVQAEPVDEVVERAAFVAEAKRRGWKPGEFMLGAYAGWLASKLATPPKFPATEVAQAAPTATRPDVEKIMRLADQFAAWEAIVRENPSQGSIAASKAAREALRASLTKGDGA